MYTYEWTEAGQEPPESVLRLIVDVSGTDPFIGLPPQPTEEDVAALSARLASGVRAGTTELLAVRAPDGATVGCVAMNRSSTANQRHIAELTTGAVHPTHRGRGVVPSSFAAVVRRCEATGIELLRLDVREGIPAERVWRQLGFTEYGRLEDYGRVDGKPYAGVYLSQTVRHLKDHLNSLPQSEDH